MLHVCCMYVQIDPNILLFAGFVHYLQIEIIIHLKLQN